MTRKGHALWPQALREWMVWEVVGSMGLTWGDNGLGFWRWLSMDFGFTLTMDAISTCYCALYRWLLVVDISKIHSWMVGFVAITTFQILWFHLAVYKSTPFFATKQDHPQTSPRLKPISLKDARELSTPLHQSWNMSASFLNSYWLCCHKLSNSEKVRLIFAFIYLAFHTVYVCALLTILVPELQHLEHTHLSIM